MMMFQKEVTLCLVTMAVQKANSKYDQKSAYQTLCTRDSSVLKAEMLSQGYYSNYGVSVGGVHTVPFVEFNVCSV